jgi:hypothetical protein
MTDIAIILSLVLVNAVARAVYLHRRAGAGRHVAG